MSAYREMTLEQRADWGEAERKARIADLSKPRSSHALAAAQANSEARRKAIGATSGQAADMVISASRAIRRSAS
jgi:hypothetical protein